MTATSGRADRTTLNALIPNLDIGDVADPALRLAYFNYMTDLSDANYDYTTGLISAGTLSRLGVINVKDYNASGSANTYTGSITSGSRTLTTTAASDFANGQGISIPGAGAAGATLVTTVSNISGVTITLATAASTTVSGATIRHDDTVAIQAAIDAIPSSGGWLYFPAGTHNISSGLQFDTISNLTILSPFAEIKFANSTTDTLYSTWPNYGLDSIFRMLNCQNVLVEGLKLNGNISNRMAYGASESHNCNILLAACKKVTIRNCELTESMTDGVLMFRNQAGTICENIRVENCKISKNRRNNISTVDVDGFWIDGNLIIEAGTIQGTSPKSGIGVEPDNGVNKVQNGYIINNSIKDNAGDGSYCGGDGSRRIQYVDNLLTGNTSDGLNVEASNTDITVKGGRIDSNGLYGVRTVGTGCTVIDGATITNNLSGVVPQIADGLRIINCEINNNLNNGIETGTGANGFKRLIVVNTNFKNNNSATGFGNGEGYAMHAYPFDSSSFLKFDNNTMKSTVGATYQQKGALVTGSGGSMTGFGNTAENLSGSAMIGISGFTDFGTAAPTSPGGSVGEMRINTTPTVAKNIALWVYNPGTGNWHAIGNGKGTTAERPTLGVNDVDFAYFDTTLAKMIIWDGTTWLV